jgi:hypothetical protein
VFNAKLLHSYNTGIFFLLRKNTCMRLSQDGQPPFTGDAIGDTL